MKKRFAILLILASYLLQSTALAEEVLNETPLQNAPQIQAEPPVYTDYPTLAENVYSTGVNLSDGLRYTRSITYHPTYGTEREYTLEYTPESSTRLAFANGEYLYKTDTIRNLAAYEYPDENYVAGINADFFNMSTGVPESAYIKDGELYTTDRDSFCLAETEDEHFFLDKPQIRLTLTSDESGTEYNILHLNKEFTEYGLYLYNARYSPTTHIKNENTAVVLYPYSEKATEKELAELLADEELDEMLADYAEIEPYSESGEHLRAQITSRLEELSGYQKIGDAYYLTDKVFPQIGKTEKLVAANVNPTAGNEDIPENAYLLCADNRSYGYILMAFQPGDTFALDVAGNESFHTVKNAVGTGAVIVKDSEAVDDRTFDHYMSPQPRSAVGIRADGSLVFYAVDGRQKEYSAGLKLLDLAERMVSLGCVYAANLDGGGSTAVNASLPGFDNADTVNSPSGKVERKISNAVIFTDTSEKVGIPVGAYAYEDYYLTLSDWNIPLGSFVLSDKNGFAADNMSETETESVIEGEDTSDTNDTSNTNDDTETEVISEESQDTPENIENPEMQEPVAAVTETVEETAHEASDETEDEPRLPENLSLYTKDGKGFVADGTFYPAGNAGVIEVFASLDGGMTENVAATVVSLETPDKIVLSAEKSEIAPFESVQISAAAFYRTLNVSSGFDSFGWSISEVPEEAEPADNTGHDGDESVKTAEKPPIGSPDIIVDSSNETPETEEEPIHPDESEIPAPVYGVLENGVFHSATEGKTLEITASRGDVSGTLRLTVNAYPFADMRGHWAVKEIYRLAEAGVVKGETDSEGTAFYLPERQFSRYEFCVMLARMTGIGSELDIPPQKPEETESAVQTESSEESTEQTEIQEPIEPSAEEPQMPTLDFADAEAVPEWAYESVYRLYVSGILDGILRTDAEQNMIFAGSEPITRAEVIEVIGRICEAAPEDFSLEHFTDLNEAQKQDDSIRNAVSAGIFSGYEDLSLRLSGLLTRAEGAAVFMRLRDHLTESGETM